MRQLIYILTVIVCSHVSAQEVIPTRSIKLLPGSKGYWAYHVERVGTAHDSLHYYMISVSLAQIDSAVKLERNVKIDRTRVYCMFTENGKKRKISCVPTGNGWIADFSIHTNQILAVTIMTHYNKQNHKLTLKLNNGTYPGENEEGN